jgi:hypothetical protein
MQGDDPAGEFEPEIFSLSADRADLLAYGCAGQMGGRLRFCGDGVEDVDTADSSPFD